MDIGESIKETLGMNKRMKENRDKPEIKCKYYSVNGKNLCYVKGYECFEGNASCRYFERGEKNGPRTN